MAATAARAGCVCPADWYPICVWRAGKRPAVFLPVSARAGTEKDVPRQGTSLLSADSAAVVLRVRRVAVVPLRGRGETYSPSSSSSGSRMLV